METEEDGRRGGRDGAATGEAPAMVVTEGPSPPASGPQEQGKRTAQAGPASGVQPGKRRRVAASPVPPAATNGSAAGAGSGVEPEPEPEPAAEAEADAEAGPATDAGADAAMSGSEGSDEGSDGSSYEYETDSDSDYSDEEEEEGETAAAGEEGRDGSRSATATPTAMELRPESGATRARKPSSPAEETTGNDNGNSNGKAQRPSRVRKRRKRGSDADADGGEVEAEGETGEATSSGTAKAKGKTKAKTTRKRKAGGKSRKGAGKTQGEEGGGDEDGEKRKRKRKKDKKKQNRRRDIKQVMDERALDKTTLAAREREEQRMQRQKLLQRQRAEAQQAAAAAAAAPSAGQTAASSVGLAAPPPALPQQPTPTPTSLPTSAEPSAASAAVTGPTAARPEGPGALAQPQQPPCQAGAAPPAVDCSWVNDIRVHQQAEQQAGGDCKMLRLLAKGSADAPLELDDDSSEDELEKLMKTTLPYPSNGLSMHPPSSFMLNGVEPIVLSSGESDSGDGADPDLHQLCEDFENRAAGFSHTDDSENTADETGIRINMNAPPGEPPIYLADEFTNVLKAHQIGGVRFMWDNVIESLEMYQTDEGYGCILAHSMGLGKTLQVVSFSHTILKKTDVDTVLIVVPVNTIQNWRAEFEKWIEEENAVNVFMLSDNCKTYDRRIAVLNEWHEKGGCLLIGYEMFRTLADNKRRKPRGKASAKSAEEQEAKRQADQAAITTALFDPGPDVIICDEGHRIKNQHASISQALKRIHGQRRVVLTGYPLQNNLEEYWCMVDFVRPAYLGNLQEFANMFQRPIQNGQCMDSNLADVKLSKYRTHVLHHALSGFVQRRGEDVLRTALPNKTEFVIPVRLTPVQEQLYLMMLQQQSSGSTTSLFKLYALATKIWNHPDSLHAKYLQLSKNVDEAAAAAPVEGKGKQPSIPGAQDEHGFHEAPNLQFLSPTRTKAQQRTEGALAEYQWAKPILDAWKPGVPQNSGKMMVLLAIINTSVALGARTLVFSQSLSTLDLIEKFLYDQNVPGTGNRWANGRSYFRLDGSTSAAERQRMIRLFNDSEHNKNVHVFLLSTRAGSLGINLIGANRVVIFDTSWNPCHDAQAICRVYRYGQKKGCHIYRLVADGTMEKKIYDRQISKQGMSNRVVDVEQTARMFSTGDLEELYLYEKPGPQFARTPDPLEGRDPVMATLCREYASYFSAAPFAHHSLLASKDNEALTEDEKRRAVKEYVKTKRDLDKGPMLAQAAKERALYEQQMLQQRLQQQRMQSQQPGSLNFAWRLQADLAQRSALPGRAIPPSAQPPQPLPGQHLAASAAAAASWEQERLRGQRNWQLQQLQEQRSREQQQRSGVGLPSVPPFLLRFPEATGAPAGQPGQPSFSALPNPFADAAGADGFSGLFPPMLAPLDHPSDGPDNTEGAAAMLPNIDIDMDDEEEEPAAPAPAAAAAAAATATASAGTAVGQAPVVFQGELLPSVDLP